MAGFILYVVKKNKKVYFKGLNIFIVKQINSKVNTNFLSMSVICLMLFLTIGMLSTGLSFKEALESGLKAVSYTHLDVYKRQFHRFTKAAGAEKIYERKEYIILRVKKGYIVYNLSLIHI